jgi:transcriptional regulator with XRE-family HTH domain
MNIGHKIKKIRELKGYDQQYMANQLGIHQTTYSRMESDPEKLSMAGLEKIAGILKVDPMAIMTFDEKTVFNISTQKNEGNAVGASGFIINHFPEKLHELYEARIKDKDEEIRFLRERIIKLDAK